MHNSKNGRNYLQQCRHCDIHKPSFYKFVGGPGGQATSTPLPVTIQGYRRVLFLGCYSAVGCCMTIVYLLLLAVLTLQPTPMILKYLR